MCAFYWVNRRLHFNEAVVAKIRTLNPAEVQHCFQIMEHTAWHNVSNPSGWIVGMINRERRRLQAVGMLQAQVNEQHRVTAYPAIADPQQAMLTVPREVSYSGSAGKLAHEEPVHQVRVGMGHALNVCPERFMTRPLHLLDILSEGLADDHPQPLPGIQVGYGHDGQPISPAARYYHPLQPRNDGGSLMPWNPWNPP